MENSPDDYNSKVSKLLNNFSDDMDVDADLLTQPRNVKITFIQDKNNEDVLINLKNDEQRYIEIPLKKLNLDLGASILNYVGDLLESKVKKTVKKEKEKDKNADVKSSQIVSTKPPQTNRKKIHFSTSNSSISKQPTQSLNNSENEFFALINNDRNKILKLRMSYREYFYSSPKCDICDQTGITTEELKKWSSNKELQLDCVVLDYTLYQCLGCKIYLHKNCAYEVSNFPSINVKETPMKTNWICDRCKMLPQSDDICQCQICNKKDNQLKKPHFYKMLDKNFWVHFNCLFWFRYAFNIADEK